MNKNEVFKIILDEKIKIDNIKNEHDLTQWFWKVGFRNITIDEDKKIIICEVSRPNPFISKFRKPIANFLIYLTNQVFAKLGYTFELKKYTEDEYYDMYTTYIKNVEVFK